MDVSEGFKPTAESRAVKAVRAALILKDSGATRALVKEIHPQCAAQIYAISDLIHWFVMRSISNGHDKMLLS